MFNVVINSSLQPLGHNEPPKVTVNIVVKDAQKLTLQVIENSLTDV